MSEVGAPRVEKAAPDRQVVEAAIATACARIAPLWPLTHFVGVNPFLGFADRSFHATCATMYRIARVDMLMPRAFYSEAIARGEITDADLAEACGEAPQDWRVPSSIDELKAALRREAAGRVRHPAHVPSVAEVLDSLAGGDRIASGTAFMIDEISKWCAAYFDEGQSVWRLPGRGLKPYAAWRQLARFDRNPEVMGIRAFRSIVGALPEDPVNTVIELVLRQGVPTRAIADYLHQALLDINGWASYARYLAWNAEQLGRTDDTIVHLLAIRLAWGYALFEQHVRHEEFRAAWHGAMAQAALPPIDERIGDDPDLCIDLLAHEAYEIAYRRRLFASLATAPRSSEPRHRPFMQAAFCIDVRSEVFRRALEAECPDAETI
ncbi:MAG TPA: putative inorganic carbon transporter subunit DabA, partial [Oscillatoriaceae cyanobacterium]